MTVDDQAIRDRVAPFIPPGSPTATLLEQLHSGMGDLELGAVAVALVRSLAKREAS